MLSWGDVSGVKCSPHQHENLGHDPRSDIKMGALVTYSKMGGGGRRIPRTHGQTSPGGTSKRQEHKKIPCLKRRGKVGADTEGCPLTSTNAPYTNTHNH